MITKNINNQDLEEMSEMSKSELWKPTSITPVMQELEKSNDFQPHSFKMLAG